MKQIDLVDNRRYISSDLNDKYSIKRQYFNILIQYIESNANPLTINNFNKTYLLNNTKENMDILTIGIEKGSKYIQTGNMIGKLYFIYKEEMIVVNIGLRFDDKEDNSKLEFLLDYSNSIYSNSINIGNAKSKQNRSNKVIELILTKMFINSLSKASVMGLPTVYEEIKENSYNFSGRVDINQLISKELPFKGKTPHIKNEKRVVSCIASLLLKAIDILYYNSIHFVDSLRLKKEERKKILQEELSKLSTLVQVKNTIKQSIKPVSITRKVINEALNHPILQHQSFYEYKNTLYFASLIIDGFKEPKIENIKGQTVAYILDISKVWENFIVRLLEKHISTEWKIIQEPKLKLFKNRPDNIFGLSNYMLPDIVMLNENKKQIMIFDAKFKNSKWFNREDFYKTTTYISYYQNHINNYKVITSGQIYPDKNLNDINQNLGFLDSDTDFRLFGIDIVNEVINKNNKIQFIDIIKEIIIKQT